MFVHEPNDRGKVGSSKGVLHLLNKQLIGLQALKMPHPAIQIVLTQVKRSVGNHVRVLRYLEPDLDAPNGQTGFASAPELPIFLVNGEGINARLVRIGFKQRAHGEMSAHLLPVHDRWFDEALVDPPAVAELLDIASRRAEAFEKTGFQIDRD